MLKQEAKAETNHLGTKAETLRLLYKRIIYGEILPQYSFTVSEWERERDKVLLEFQRLDWGTEVIVRSSSLSEDTQAASQAGKYESIPNVSGVSEFEAAVNKVIASYDDDNSENQILVQPMLKNVRICGVAFTMEPSTGAYYYVINYDETGFTSSITSGKGTCSKLYYQVKNEQPKNCPADIQLLVLALKELEEFFGQENLDVEFAVTERGKLYILQVRELCSIAASVDKDMQYLELNRIKNKLEREQAKKPFLCGRKAIYGVMTDWNPAEMIGIRPKPLAVSLYRELITDGIWAYQRDNYGYRNLRSFPLMLDFGGLPYIDIRVSFNSFIPADLDEEISEKLVNYYLERLAANPHLHDKAEFEIIFSCYSFDLPEKIEILKKYGFSEDEIRQITDALRNVTNRICDYQNGLWRRDYEKIKILEERYNEIMNSNMDNIEKVYWLLEDCKRYGTLPFAGLARAAFIAVQILRSMVSCDIMTISDYESFMSDINTVSSDMNSDFQEMTRQQFLNKYGHLRPGTYEITSLRYDEAPETYFDWNDRIGGEKNEKGGAFRLSLEQLNKLRTKQIENGLTNDILELMDFIKTVIEGREYGKFAFTRNLSKAIQMIGQIGNDVGISKEDCAYIDIQTIKKLYISTCDIYSDLLYSIQKGKKAYELSRVITLPPLIVEPEAVMGFYYPDSEPNFITSNKVEAEVYVLSGEINVEDIEERILLIPSADPGYDWIFSHKIKGFITMYGGANSHMAIRAGELGIPAAIGVGSQNFEKYKKAKLIEIDSLSKWIKILR